jgi:hypothetical protein
VQAQQVLLLNHDPMRQGRVLMETKTLRNRVLEKAECSTYTELLNRQMMDSQAAAAGQPLQGSSNSHT